MSDSMARKLETLSTDKVRLLKLLLEKESRRERRIDAVDRSGAYGSLRLPTSWAQERLWFIDHLEGAGEAYHIGIALRLRGKLDETALQRGLDDIVERHEALHTRFVTEEGEPKQQIESPAPFALRTFDLSALALDERDAQVRVHKTEEMRTRFDLSVGPLVRGRLLRLAPDDYMLLVTMHHIISDGWSVGVFLRELQELYGARRAGLEIPLKPLPIQYADYAEWQRREMAGDTFDSQLGYWRVRLEGAPPQLDLPTDRPRPAVQSHRGGSFNVVLDARLSRKLKAFSQRNELTLFMVLCAGWVILLSRLSNQDDLVIGTPVANRQRSELEGLIGFFVNTLVLRVDASSEKRLRDFLRHIKEITLQAFDHQDVPFERVVEALQPERSLSRNPLFQTMFVLQNAPKSALQLPDLHVTPEEGVHQASQFDLLLSMAERGDEIAGTVIYAADLFDRETVERWMACFTVLLDGMVSGVQSRLGELPLLPGTELHQVVHAFNATATPFPETKLVPQLFEEQVENTPDVLAVIHETRMLTYAELNRRANQLARHLMTRGAGPDRLVAMCVERGLDMIIGVLGILKAGAAYMPLDPSYPADRLRNMLADAAPHLILTQSELRTVVHEIDAEVVTLDIERQEVASRDSSNISVIESRLTSDHLLYVIYTSGSTGRPKGTGMPHRSMVNLIEWHRRNLSSHHGQRVLQFAALSFDVAFQEMSSTLCTGGTLVTIDEWIRRDAEALTALLNRQRVQRIFVPPLMLQALAEAANTGGRTPGSLEDVIAAGDQLVINPEVSRLFTNLKGCRLHNHYGPTETHVVTSLTISAGVGGWPVFPSIGRPIANSQIYVLNTRQQPVPIGVVGEIYIGGVGIARGYLHRPELTALRFAPNPFGTEPRSRLYRTGDLGQWRADGTLVYLGRNDQQVKIRGYRVELGEIESRLAQCEAVKESVVIAREDAPGDRRLVAYVTTDTPGALRVDDLRAVLKSALPDHMVPSAFVVLDRFPVTPNGKLDRKALPTPTVYVSRAYEAPVGEVEKVVAGIWQELLRLDRIGRQESFFEVGGHSLLTLKAVFRINQHFGSSLQAADAYRNPTIKELASRISAGVGVDERVELQKEADLHPDIVPARGSLRTPPHCVLLTGCTGFVGRFLLAQLLEDTDATIYCFVRASSSSQALARIKNVLCKWNLWRDAFDTRIVGVPGELSRPQLGIEGASYEFLAENIDSIYHCATSMNHLETYAMAKPANVESARELLKLATQGKPKLLNYLSTLGVFSPPESGGARVVREQTPIDRERHWLSRGYAASKWVGERVFLTAGERGIPCNIFRLGLVWADTQQGRYDELQRGYRLLKSCLLSGFGIANYRHDMAPTPADYVARSVVFLASQYDAGGGIFHISSCNQEIDGLYERCNEIARTALQLVPLYDWICRIKRLNREGIVVPAVPLIEYAFNMDERTFYEQRRRSQSQQLQFDCGDTHRELERAGIFAPVLDDELLSRCLTSMMMRDADLQNLSNRESMSQQSDFRPTRHDREGCNEWQDVRRHA